MKQLKCFSTFFFAVLLMSVVGCASTATQEGTGEYIENSVITLKVKAALFNEPTLKSAEINVETFKGVVTQQDGGKLEVFTTSGHDNPLMQGCFPLLLNHVWEHAYYLKHENRRADYLHGWWTVVNWEEAARRFESSDQSPERRWKGESGLVLRATK